MNYDTPGDGAESRVFSRGGRIKGSPHYPENTILFYAYLRIIIVWLIMMVYILQSASTKH